MTNKFFKSQFNLVALLLLVLFAGLYSCSDKITSDETTTIAQANVAPAASVLKTASLQSFTLWAGQTTNVGNITVTNDASNIYVTYTLTNGGTFGTLHLWIGTDLATVPSTPNGTPIPGQFPYSFNASGLSTYTFTVPFQVLCEASVYVVAHAEVGGETAFAGGTPINVGDAGRWWYYVECKVKEVVPPTATDVKSTVYCLSEIPTETPEVITDEADNCALAAVPVTFVDETSTAAGVCPKVITRNYLVTDAAGNTTAVKHTITVVDEIAPVWVVSTLPSKTAACEEALVFDEPVAIDCNGYSLSSTDATAQPVTANGIISTSTTRTWYAADACGNKSVALTQTITVNCTPPTSSGPCFDTSSETAWAAGTKYVKKGSWATYVTYVSGTSINLYAGQTKLIGTATFSAPVAGQVTISVNITAPGWELVPGVENVKVQGYNSTPAASNPSPGLFANKLTGSGTTATITVPAAKYYGVHLDVQLKVEVPCPL